jgi:cholesterol transport system auxiliary component
MMRHAPRSTTRPLRRESSAPVWTWTWTWTWAWALCVPAALLLSACSSLWPAASPQPAYFALQGLAAAAPTTKPLWPARAAPNTAPNAAPNAAPVLVVQVPHAAPGFESSHIIYTQQPHRLEYFARHEWVEAPARMLAPLMVAALERQTGFGAVVLAPSVATGSVQLDTQLLRLQQEFGSRPSRVRLTLRAQLIHTASRQVLATRDFEQVATSASEDAPGGVAAAQAAVQAMLTELAAWCQVVVAAPR